MYFHIHLITLFTVYMFSLFTTVTHPLVTFIIFIISHLCHFCCTARHICPHSHFGYCSSSSRPIVAPVPLISVFQLTTLLSHLLHTCHTVTLITYVTTFTHTKYYNSLPLTCTVQHLLLACSASPSLIALSHHLLCLLPRLW